MPKPPMILVSSVSFLKPSVVGLLVLLILSLMEMQNELRVFRSYHADQLSSCPSHTHTQ
jgi:hypothetical protein